MNAQHAAGGGLVPMGRITHQLTRTGRLARLPEPPKINL